MARLYPSNANYIPPNTASQVLHSGPGKVHIIIASTTSASAETLVLYDNTAASGNVLLQLAVSAATPAAIILPPALALSFSSGLTAVTGANLAAFVATQA